MEGNEIILIPAGNTPERIDTSIQAFNQPLANLLTHIGLPTENILTSVEERRKVIFALESTLDLLPHEERYKAVYLSKFTVAISVGLFDGALNFLWDETVNAIRRLAANFDLQYFFNIAATTNAKYKGLNSTEDLPVISDHDLIEICRRIGLLSDVTFRRLEHVNYFRNHASAAHPNENEITGTEMLSFLEYCLRYAITAKPDHSVIQIKQLFDNIRTKEIPKEDFPSIGADLQKQSQERINDFVLSVFGLYCNPKQEQSVRKNIERLMRQIWHVTTDDVRYFIGAKYGLHRNNGDVDRKDAVQKFLENVNALDYKDEDSLAAELLEKLQNLKTVHYEWNNFYNERSHAQSISTSIPKGGIPDSIRKLFVKVVSICYVGNGKGYKEGVDTGAVPYYQQFIEMFGVNEVKEFIFLFNDAEFVSDLWHTKPDKRLRQLATFLKTKTKDVQINKVLDLIVAFPNRALEKLASDSRYKEAVKFIK